MLVFRLVVFYSWLIVCVSCEYTYNETEARIMANLAAAAYSLTPADCVNRTLPNDWFVYQQLMVKCDEISSLCGSYILRSDKRKHIILVFRGTKTQTQLLLEGWKSFRDGREFYGVGKANRYFFHALRIMWPSIEPILRDPVFSEYAVTVTGHSLGGALASLAALKIALDKLRPSHQIKMISFGQPRVGDYQLAVSHNKLVPNSFRVVHRKDIVPHVPPCDKNDSHSIDDSKACDISSTDVAYHHLTEVWYPEDMVGGGQYIVCNGHPLGEDMKCSDKLTFKLSGRKEYVYDHRHYFGHRGDDGLVVNIAILGVSTTFAGKTSHRFMTNAQKYARFGSLVPCMKHATTGIEMPSSLPVYGRNGCREVAGVLSRLYGASKTISILLLIRYLLAK